MSDSNDGCLQIVGIIIFLWFTCFGFKQCQCAMLKLSEETPPYISTDDNRYHRDQCPYMNEDNYVGDEYESREAAESNGLTPCPHCLE